MPFRLVQKSENGTEILLPRSFGSIDEANREVDSLRGLFPDRTFIVEEFEARTLRHVKFHPDRADPRKNVHA